MRAGIAECYPHDSNALWVKVGHRTVPCLFNKKGAPAIAGVDKNDIYEQTRSPCIFSLIKQSISAAGVISGRLNKSP